MSRLLITLLLAAGFILASGCPTPPPQTRPDYQKVRQNHKKAQQQLEQEEDSQED